MPFESGLRYFWRIAEGDLSTQGEGERTIIKVGSVVFPVGLHLPLVVVDVGDKVTCIRIAPHVTRLELPAEFLAYESNHYPAAGMSAGSVVAPKTALRHTLRFNRALVVHRDGDQAHCLYVPHALEAYESLQLPVQVLEPFQPPEPINLAPGVKVPRRAPKRREFGFKR